MKEIKLTQGKVALVDDEDFDSLNAFKWKAQKAPRSWYANRVDYSTGKSKILYMHRVVMGISERIVLVDHKDHDGLNNQKNNLRKCTVSENAMNRNPLKGCTSKYLGVCKYKNKWRAGLKHNSKQYHLGDYENELDAAKAYNEGAIKIHGSFAKINTI